MKIKISDIAMIGLAAAVLCVLAPVSVPIGPVPISLATFGLYVVSASFGKFKAPIAVLVYIAVGAVGLPVFSGFTGGVAKLIGATGGYIIGYIPCAFLVGLMVDKWEKNFIIYPISMVLGTLVFYTLGTLWYMYVTKSTFVSALTVCVVPFLIFDAVKIIVASIASFSVRKTIKQGNF